MRASLLLPHLLIPLLVASAVRAQATAPATADRPIAAAELRRVERAAGAVTIVRDRYGVPHVYAPTDAGVTLGVGYAQAEDNFWLLEEEYLRALGRTAEVYGDSMLVRDAARRAMGGMARARAQYAKATPAFRAMMAGYADGINLWIARHPDAPRLLRRWEPWHAFAFEGAGMFSGGTAPSPAALGLAPRGTDREPGTQRPDDPGEGEAFEEAMEGSNAWALAPARTTTGHAMLFVNPHWNFFQQSQRWEVHVESGTGWRFSGFCILGNPIPRSGHNGRLGWTHTNLALDTDDMWAVMFDHPTDSLLYRYGNGWRRATTWSDTIRTRTDSGVQSRVVHGRATHHGAVFAWPAAQRAIAVRTVGAELTESPLVQRYRMARSRNLAQWRDAMALRTYAGSNTTYADADGNILLAVGNAVPKRRPGLDVRAVHDGADSTTEWLGLHPIAEVPHLLNPRSGYVQNTNSSVWMATDSGSNMDSASFAPYMALDRDNARARSSRRLLGGSARYTFASWMRLTMDHRVQTADEELPALFEQATRMARTNPARTASLGPLLDTLRAWNRVSDTLSVAMTLFVHQDRERRLNGRADAADSGTSRVAALERARDSLVSSHGRWTVPWGAVNRLQRVHPSGLQAFDAARPSWAVPHIDGNFGTIANMTSTPMAAPAQGRGVPGRATSANRRHGVAGNSYVAVVHFAPTVEAHSLLTFGQSADSTSPHHVDQAPLYAAATYKPAWFDAASVDANARRAYHPGGPDLPKARVPAFARRTSARPKSARR